MNPQSPFEITNGRYWPVGDKPLPSLTTAGWDFVDEHARLLDVLHYYHDLGFKRMEPLLQAAQRYQSAPNEKKTASAVPEDEDLQVLMKQYKNDFEKLPKLTQMLGEFALTRTADNFITYISDLLALIYNAKPELLRSKDQRSLDYILQYESMDELRNAIAERKVESLAYKGLRALDKYLTSRMKFKLFEVDEERERAALIVEYRNLYSHNRGVVSALSARRFPELAPLLGKRIPINQNDIRNLRQALEHAVFDIDVRAVAAFSLPAHKVEIPPSEQAPR